jgi:excisionase family DNA binding protein
MGRQRKRSLFPVFLSLDSAAEAMECRRKTLSDAVAAGKLEAYRDPTSKRVRVAVEDLVRYVKENWRRA